MRPTDSRCVPSVSIHCVWSMQIHVIIVILSTEILLLIIITCFCMYTSKEKVESVRTSHYSSQTKPRPNLAKVSILPGLYPANGCHDKGQRHTTDYIMVNQSCKNLMNSFSKTLKLHCQKSNSVFLPVFVSLCQFIKNVDKNTETKPQHFKVNWCLFFHVIAECDSTWCCWCWHYRQKTYYSSSYIFIYSNIHYTRYRLTCWLFFENCLLHYITFTRFLVTLKVTFSKMTSSNVLFYPTNTPNSTFTVTLNRE